MPVYDFFMSEKSRKQTTNEKSFVLKISATGIFTSKSQETSKFPFLLLMKFRKKMSLPDSYRDPRQEIKMCRNLIQSVRALIEQRYG